MKTLASILAGSIVGVSLALAQTTVTTTPVAGTLTTFDPTGQSIVVTSPGSATPVTYAYTSDTVLVDDAGNPVTVDVIKSGLPVSVYYTRQGDRVIASKMVVRRSAPATAVEETTTTTTTTTP